MLICCIAHRSVRTRRFESLSTQDFAQFIVIGLLAGCFWYQRAKPDTLSAAGDTLGRRPQRLPLNGLQECHNGIICHLSDVHFGNDDSSRILPKRQGQRCFKQKCFLMAGASLASVAGPEQHLWQCFDLERAVSQRQGICHEKVVVGCLTQRRAMEHAHVSFHCCKGNITINLGLPAICVAGAFHFGCHELTKAYLAGLLFFQLMFMSFRTLFVALFTFPNEFKMLLKERASGMYRLSAFYFARTASVSCHPSFRTHHWSVGCICQIVQTSDRTGKCLQS